MSAFQHTLRSDWRVSVLALLLCAGISSCNSDVKSDSSGNAGQGNVPVGDPAGDPVNNPGSGIIAANDAYSIRIGGNSLTLIEGGNIAAVAIEITRFGDHSQTVTLAAEGRQGFDERQLSWQFDDASLDANDSATVLNLRLAIDRLPIQAETRVLRIIAADGLNQPIVAELSLQIEPTQRPDVYLLAGQSNMLGFSQPDAKLVGAGQADAPVDRILQLNVTGNDGENFGSAADFTNNDRLAATDPRYVRAVDPLHDGFDTRIFGKAAGFIGPGLSFAKSALADTSATIYLVPAAWSDSGFCKRDTNLLDDLGWNASSKRNGALSGTLLHDRAIARANLVLAETGGILRGILWHQGEADSDDVACAVAYEENIRELAASLRSNIVADARGSTARGANSDVPFIIGTMSRGSDSRGDQLPFNDFKAIVDGVHRNITSVIPQADVVINDDLVPPAYACGEGSCVHFGAAAYREMGARYYERLRAVAQ